VRETETVICGHCQAVLDYGGSYTNGKEFFCDAECCDAAVDAKECGNCGRPAEDDGLCGDDCAEKLAGPPPIIKYQVAQLPHVLIEPCPECRCQLELYGSMVEATPMDPFIARALTGRSFKLQCPKCETILQVEKPRILVK
jgi:hypothetical protein